jgi:uncharacterized membrane protein YdjX (TVP38/TMEM64 family)
MSRSRFLSSLVGRLQKKLLALVPIVIGAGVFTVILTVVVYLITPSLPPVYQDLLQQVQNGDWTAGRESLSRLFHSYGPAKPYAFLALQIAQVLFAPIPGQLVGLLGGYAFGFWYGLVLTMIGLAIGSAIAMAIGRLLGERMVRKFVPAELLRRFDHLVAEGGLANFFMIYLLPAFPDDAICFMAGMTRLPIWQLILVCLLGRLPGMAVLLYVGASVGRDTVIANVLLVVAMVAAAILWLYSEEAEQFVHRLSGRWGPWK